MPERPRLFLVDGYALIYRAFFAMMQRPLTTSRGENTSAAWGVANFLLRLLDKHKPDMVAWVHDAGHSFRKDTFPDYKATREKLDETLQEEFDQSVRRIEEMLEAWRIPLLEVKGYEADDVIGTLTAQATDAGLDVVIVSGDKDLYQLIGPHVGMLNPGRRGPAAVDEQFIDQSNAAERFGVPPACVVDYLALVGDSSDNIPGVRGIGDKTARKLIEQYGTLDAILDHATDVTSNRIRTALIEQAEAARLSRELVTILRDVPVTLDEEALRRQSPDRAALARIFTELEFHSLLPRVEGTNPEPHAAAIEAVVVDETSQIQGVVEEIRASGTVACDLLYDGGCRSASLVGIGAAIASDRAWYFPIDHGGTQRDLVEGGDDRNLPGLGDPSMRGLVALLEDSDLSKVFHNAKDAELAFRSNGITLAGVSFDTMLAGFLLHPGRRSQDLETLAREHLGRALPSYDALVGKGAKARAVAEATVEEAAKFAGDRATSMVQLWESCGRELDGTALRRLLDDVEMPLGHVLAAMEWRGIKIDLDFFRTLQQELDADLGALERAIYDAAGTDFNINSTPQLRTILFEKLMLPVLKKTKTGPSTDADVLDELAGMGHDVPRLILEYRELSKLKSTYVDALPERVDSATGRIHTTFNQTGAATGRLSSSDPNLQNIPIRTDRGGQIRRGFIPEKGHQFLVADYSQIELRLLAHLSEDPAFVEAFAQGGDIHRQTAAVIFDVGIDEVTADMRARAKTINFATIYGQGPFALARQLGIATDDARAFIQQYFERFSGVRSWLDRTISATRERGYVETIFGRRRYIPEINDRKHNVRAFGERTATNSPLQGSAADLIKVAMIRIHAALAEAKLDAAILLQVHDELVLEVSESDVPAVRDIVKRHMESAAELRVPLVVDIGTGSNWLEAKA